MRGGSKFIVTLPTYYYCMTRQSVLIVSKQMQVVHIELVNTDSNFERSLRIYLL
jgi:hypothetical protein